MGHYLSREEQLAMGELIQDMLVAEKELEKIAANDSVATDESDATMTTDVDTKALNERIRKGKNAVQRLVETNLDLVYSQANAFKKRYPGAPELEDIVQDGMAGLMVAVYRYDPKRGNKFTTVAVPWIFQSIMRNTNKNGRLVKLPENRVADFSNIVKLRTLHEAEGLSYSDSNAAIMKQLKLSAADLLSITNAAATSVSLNRPVSSSEGSGDGAKELIDVIAMKSQYKYRTESAEATVVNDSTQKILMDVLQSLPEKHFDVITNEFGWNADERGKVTSKAIRDKHKLTVDQYHITLEIAKGRVKEILDSMGMGFNDLIGI